MNKQEIYDYLKAHNISYEVTEHEAVFHMGEFGGVELLYPEWDAKNLFVRDDKKRNYYLITVRGDKRVDLKAFRKQEGLRNLSFGSSDELMEYLKIAPGSVSPFGLLNDPEHRVIFYIDEEFDGNKLGIHPNENTATVWIKTDDLLKLLKEHGNDVHVAKLCERENATE